MIPQSAIEAALVHLDDEEAVTDAMVAFAKAQTPYLQYLQTEGFELLGAEERDYLQYLALVVHAAVAAETGGAVPTLDGERLEAWDERCWTWLEEAGNRPFANRLDTFFARIDEEEMLAFAEDSLVDPDPEAGDEPALFTTAVSRELAFVALAVLVGALHEALAA